jgi:hypothetical protein
MRRLSRPRTYAEISGSSQHVDARARQQRREHRTVTHPSAESIDDDLKTLERELVPQMRDPRRLLAPVRVALVERGRE